MTKPPDEVGGLADSASTALDQTNKKLDAENAALIAQGERVELDADVYGAAIFSISYDLFEWKTTKDHDDVNLAVNMYRLFMILTLLIINYVLQLGLTYFSFRFVTLPGVHDAQKIYRDYHKYAFQSGQFDDSLMDADLHDELCEVAFANFFFMYVVLCIWGVTMLQEIRKTERLFRKITTVQSTIEPEDMVKKVDEDGEKVTLILRLTSLIRITLCLIVVIPKLIISCALAVVGAVWLLSSSNYGDLILNSIALEFIICIDEVIFKGLLPESIEKAMETTMLVVPSTLTGDATQDSAKIEAKAKIGWLRSSFYAVALGGFVYFFMTYGQYVPILGVFPGYDNDVHHQCDPWWVSNTADLCTPGQECFPIRGAIDKNSSSKLGMAHHGRGHGGMATVGIRHGAHGHAHAHGHR